MGKRLENIEGLRIDGYMAKKFPFQNRDTWFQRITRGEVLVEHNSPKDRLPLDFSKLRLVKPTYKLKNFDQIWSFHPHEYEPDVIEKIEIVHDDGDICVFSKPPNMVIHAAGLYQKNTFIHIASKMGYAECAPVHRIDRETSGLLVSARTTRLRRKISDAFKEGNIEKMYLAVTKGERILPEKFRVTLPIGQTSHSRSQIRLKLWIDTEEAQEAETWFAKLATFEDYTLFACLPQTGRTNQIRIHLAAVGHWIVGDKMYHKDENVFIEFYEKGFTPWVHEQTLFPRHMLHNTGFMASNTDIEALSKKTYYLPSTRGFNEFTYRAKSFSGRLYSALSTIAIRVLCKNFCMLFN